MSWPTAIDSREVAQVYGVANTPAYLYKHLRRADAVQKLAATSDAAALADLFDEITSLPNRSVVDVARAYAAIVAMTLRDYEEWRPVIERVELSRLDWGHRLRDIARAHAIPTTAVSINFKSPSGPALVNTSTSTSVQSVNQRPSLLILSDV